MWKIIFLFLFSSTLQQGCIERKLEFGKVCVCNATYCDTVPKLGTITHDKVKIYWTSSDKPGFNVKEQKFAQTKDASVLSVTVSANVTYQKIIGIGGCFTDSTGHNINLLPEGARRKLIEAFFSDDGIEYSMQRVPVGGVDFSPNFYTLDDRDEDDMELKHFALSEQDFTNKIPFIKEAISLRKGKQLDLFASTWMVPHWMTYRPGYIALKETHYQVLADYYKRFFDEYQQRGIKFWGMTTGNEPSNAFATWDPIQAVSWVPSKQAKWIRENLVPTLRNSSHKDMKIIFHDDSLESFPFTVHPVVHDGKTVDYLDGVATHWYADNRVPLRIVDLMKNPKKELFLMSSEACFFITRPLLGDWGRASYYINTVIDHFLVGYNSWIDWNLVVNSTGGPNNLNWNADAPCVLSQDNKEFYKEPFFYGLGHFSKFVIPGSVRVELSFSHSSSTLKAVAFKRPDNLRVVILFNKDTKNPTKVQLTDHSRYSEVIDVPAASVQTILFSN